MSEQRYSGTFQLLKLLCDPLQDTLTVMAPVLITQHSKLQELWQQSKPFCMLCMDLVLHCTCQQLRQRAQDY